MCPLTVHRRIGAREHKKWHPSWLCTGRRCGMALVARMSLRLLEHIWDPDSTANADWFETDSGAAVLLDGAAPQHPASVSTMANDAVWLVRRFVEIFGPERKRSGASAGL